MKVYLDVKPQDEEYKNEWMAIIGEMVRYKTMWNLRSLEDEINNSGGNIVLTIGYKEQHGVKLNGFKKELFNKITTILNDIDLMPFH